MNMKRMLLFLLCAVLAITVASPAQAKPYRGPSPAQILTDKDLPQFVKDAADQIVLSEYGTTGMVRDSLLFLGVYAPGDIKHPPKFAEAIADAFLQRGSDVCDYDNLGVGCSSIMRGDPDITLGRPRVNDRDNTSYALYRPLQLSQKLGYRFKPVSQVIEGFPPAQPGGNQTGQGVLLIRVYKVPTVTTKPAKDTLYLKKEYRTETVREVPTFWVRPTVGFAGCWLDPQRVVTPSIGVAAGTHFGTWNVGAYAVEGQDFQPPNRGTSAYGIQFGDELCTSVRLGYRSTWTEIRGDGHTTARSEGGEVGIGYGFPAVRIGLGVAVLQYADLDNRSGSYKPALTLNVDFGPLLLAK